MRATVAGVIDDTEARKLAETVRHAGLSLGEVRELREGWLFTYHAAPAEVLHRPSGSNGVIVNKKTGRRFQLGSAFSVDRDAKLYDLGYQLGCYDLVILAVRDRDATVQALGKLRLTTVEPTYEDGQVWRVPRALNDAELRERIARLPCVFGAASLYFQVEVLEEARAAGCRA